MKIGITGASGWIGSFVLKELSKQNLLDKTFILGRRNIWNSQNYINCDFLNVDSTTDILKQQKFTHFIHLAWDLPVGKYKVSENNLNCLHASCSLAKNFFLFGGEKLFTAGTCFEYKESNENLNPNNSCCLPNMPYGISKNLIANYLTLLSSLHTNCLFTHGRIFYPIGPLDPNHRLFGGAINAIKTNTKFTFSINKENKLSVIDVRDLASLIVNYALANRNDKIVNMSSPYIINPYEEVINLFKLYDKENLLNYVDKNLKKECWISESNDIHIDSYISPNNSFVDAYNYTI